MKSRISVWLLLVGAGLWAWCGPWALAGTTSSTLESLLPRPDDVPGWAAVDKPRVLDGDELFEYMDGGAEIYREYGFRRLVVQEYRNGTGESIVLEVFEMKESGGAFGIYTFKSSSSGQEAGLGQDARLADYYLNFWKGPYLVTLTGDPSMETSPGLVALAGAVASRIAVEGSRPPGVAALPRGGMVPGSLKYFRGPLGVSNSYYFFDGDPFAVRECFSADYEGGTRLFLFCYPDADSCAASWEAVRSAFSLPGRFTASESGESGEIRVRDPDGQAVLARKRGALILIGIGPDGPRLADEVRWGLEPPGVDAGSRGGEKGAVRPPSRLRVGFSERLRYVTWDNARTLDGSAGGETAFTLQRTRLGLGWRPMEEVEAGIRLANESRLDIVPEDASGFEFGELFTDNLFLAVRRPMGLPVNLTLGRQDFVLGEGFLIDDGTPLDESRSAYFNAARAEWHPAPWGTLTAFFVSQQTRDTLLPVLHSRDQPLLEHPQTVLGLDYSTGLGEGTLEGYALSFTRSYLSLDVVTRAEVLGGRWVWRPWRALSVTAEGAFEFGRDLAEGPAGELPEPISEVRRSAFGGYVHADYSPGRPRPWPELVTLGGIFLTGDDPETPAREDWDPLFGRWAKWSESYIYSLELERGLAWWSNLASVYGSVRFLLTSRLRAWATYHHLMAPQARRKLPPPGSSGEEPYVQSVGRTRGDLFILGLEFEISKALGGHLIWESFSPGSFYRFAGLDAADGYDYLQFEFFCRF
jgi:hypothetical protein